MKAGLLVLGNVITMDEYKPYVEAVTLKRGRIMYVGTAEFAGKFCNDHTKVCDYGSNWVNPDLLEVHCHSRGAEYKMIGTARIDQNVSLEKCVQLMKENIAARPEKTVVNGAGFMVRDVLPHASMLDAICPDKVMLD